ncbi:MAG: adenylate/guanylate cyclase domain-containing protein [Rhodospirillales bacterium]|nr:adenylate/guanylate cyclase domain-containing protein [Rhodospirillales bacterium]
MNIDDISQRLMTSVRVGLAIINADDMKPVFSNEHFKKWFQVEEDGTLGLLGEQEELVASITGLEPGGTFNFDTTLKVRRRELSLSVHISCLESDSLPLVLVEVHNNTRLKEMESMIQSYSKMVERNERDLKREKERAEKLLLNVMPKSVFEELKAFGVTAPTRYDEASVLMLDFIAFTEMSIADDPAAIVSELNDIFTNFDRIVEQFGCERIKTIGDAYMAVSGLPESNPDHARNIAKAALLFIRYLEQRNKTHKNAWLARVGIASGPVIGSIVGVHKYVYDIFGPAVNLAARMERRSDPMQVTLCSPMSDNLKDIFRLIEKGEEEIKGFGKLTLYNLDPSSAGHLDAF